MRVLVISTCLLTALTQDNPGGAFAKLNEAIELLQAAPTVLVPVATAQATIDAAPVGATLVLQAGTQYPALTLKGEGKTLVSSGTLPTGRVTPSAVFAKVAHLDIYGQNWTVKNIEVTGDPSRVEMIWCDPSSAKVTIDGVLAKGSGAIRRAIVLHAAGATITRSYLYNIGSGPVDSQGIGCWNGPGPYAITDNYIEAGSENIMFGGNDPSVPGLIPSDIEIAGNTLFKPEAWRTLSMNVKNLLELKNAQRVSIHDNEMSGSWTQGQQGYGLMLTVRNQNGGCPWCTVQHVRFVHNHLSRIGAGVNILGLDDKPGVISVQATDIVIDTNQFDLDVHPNDAARLLQLSGGGPSQVQFTNNTSTNTGVQNSFIAVHWPQPRLVGFVYTGNNVYQGTYGIVGDGLAPGIGVLNTAAPGYTWSANTVHKGTSTAKVTYPAGTTVVP